MSDDTNNPSEPKRTGKLIIQPSEAFKQEMAAQSEPAAETKPSIPSHKHVEQAADDKEGIKPEPSAAPTDLPASTQQPIGSTTTYDPTASEASNKPLTHNQETTPKSTPPKSSHKRKLITALVIFALLGGILITLVLTKVIVLNEFKAVTYTNNKDVSYELNFYTKHTTTKLKSGNNLLVSEVPRDDKFPISLSISTGHILGYSKLRNCSGLTKVTSVKSTHLDQDISICGISTKIIGQDDGLVYVAGFTRNNQLHTVTISQDTSSANLSSPNAARDTLTRFGMEPYREDIEKIIASIKVAD